MSLEHFLFSSTFFFGFGSWFGTCEGASVGILVPSIWDGDTLVYGPDAPPFSVCEAILALQTGHLWASPTDFGLWASPTDVLWALPTEVVFWTPSTEVSGWVPPTMGFSEVWGPWGSSTSEGVWDCPTEVSGKWILFSSPWIWAMRATFITLSSLIVLWSCLFSSPSWEFRSSRSACSTAATLAHVLPWSEVFLCCASAFFLASLGLNPFSACSFSVTFSTKYFGHSWSEALWGPEQLEQCGESCLLPRFDKCDKVHRLGHSYKSSEWIIVLGQKNPRYVNRGHWSLKYTTFNTNWQSMLMMIQLIFI